VLEEDLATVEPLDSDGPESKGPLLEFPESSALLPAEWCDVLLVPSDDDKCTFRCSGVIMSMCSPVWDRALRDDKSPRPLRLTICGAKEPIQCLVEWMALWRPGCAAEKGQEVLAHKCPSVLSVLAVHALAMCYDVVVLQKDCATVLFPLIVKDRYCLDDAPMLSPRARVRTASDATTVLCAAARLRDMHLAQLSHAYLTRRPTQVHFLLHSLSGSLSLDHKADSAETLQRIQLLCDVLPDVGIAAIDEAVEDAMLLARLIGTCPCSNRFHSCHAAEKLPLTGLTVEKACSRWFHALGLLGLPYRDRPEGRERPCLQQHCQRVCGPLLGKRPITKPKAADVHVSNRYV
jgi:hypothetical protein